MTHQAFSKDSLPITDTIDLNIGFPVFIGRCPHLHVCRLISSTSDAPNDRTWSTLSVPHRLITSPPAQCASCATQVPTSPDAVAKRGDRHVTNHSVNYGLTQLIEDKLLLPQTILVYMVAFGEHRIERIQNSISLEIPFWTGVGNLVKGLLPSLMPVLPASSGT